MNYHNALSLAQTLGMLNEHAHHEIARRVAAGEPSPLRSYEGPDGFVVEWPTRSLPLAHCWVGSKGQARLRSLARRLGVRPYPEWA